MAFNEEVVVRAFAESRLPIISAVGHEIDHPLSDLAADYFAPTPSAAAERAVPVIGEILETLEDAGLRLRVALHNRHKHGRDRLLRILKSRVHLEPRSLLESAQQSLDYTLRDLQMQMAHTIRENRMRLLEFRNFPDLYEKNLGRFAKRYTIAAERLENFSPLATLKRGYSVVRDADRNVVRVASQVKVGDELEVLLQKGRLNVRVVSKEE